MISRGFADQKHGLHLPYDYIGVLRDIGRITCSSCQSFLFLVSGLRKAFRVGVCFARGL